jgi:hypothetical protein
MNALAFDTHTAVKELRAQGFEEKQAEAIVKIVSDNTNDRLGELATKSELLAVKSELKAEIAETKAELKTDIAELKAELKAEIAGTNTEIKENRHALELQIEKLRTEMMKAMDGNMRWTIATVISATAVIIAAIKLL